MLWAERSGFGFNWITCANYTFEIYGWFFFNVATQSLMGILFMMAGGLQVRVYVQSTFQCRGASSIHVYTQARPLIRGSAAGAKVASGKQPVYAAPTPPPPLFSIGAKKAVGTHGEK